MEGLLANAYRQWNIEGAGRLNERGEFVGMCSRAGVGYAYIAIPVSAVPGTSFRSGGNRGPESRFRAHVARRPEPL